MVAPAQASTDVDEVIDELERLFDEGKKDVLLGAVRQAVEAARAENRYLVLQLKELLNRVYGRSSERIDPNQLALALEEMRQEQQADEPEPDPDAEAPNDPPVRKPSAKDRRRGRRPLPADLPREEVRLVPTEAGTAGWSKVGEQRSEVLEFVPAQFKVIAYIRETWSNEGGEIVTAPPPTKVIDKGIPGPGLLTEIVISKFRDCLPLARQCKIFARSGVELHRNRLVDWVAAVAYLLEPLAKRIHRLALLAKVLQVDDTHIKTLDRAKAKNIKRAHLWVLVGDKKYVSFRYTENWTAAKAEEFLGQRIGWMQVDGYGGYAPIAEDKPILLVGCWMHARRYFVKALEAGDIRAAEPLDIIKSMYKLEEASREAGEDFEARHARRQRDLVPLLDELELWKDKIRGQVPTKELLGKALTYLHNHWKILRVVEKDGGLELDNGEVERVIRLPAMGRRNWLFAGSDEGGHRAAIIMTVLETASRAGVDIRAYVQDVLTKVAAGWKMTHLDQLLPENWAAQQQQDGEQ